MEESSRSVSNSPNKVKHLEMIQNIIARMAYSCLAIKAMTVITIIVLLAFMALRSEFPILSLLPFIPSIIFWLLDSYYLQQGRIFKKLYNSIVERSEDKIDFYMNANIYKTYKKYRYRDTVFSKINLIFYGSLILASILIIIAVRFCF